ncbi:hypothetical protein [Labedaea rhizosphaerae]|uniref:Uncharacterized protein n=1 Tax=Labedaea rhizosphaerae TaxID=598644 RepID=A0A4R6SC49_LABRH|nr:hypothetical protein [Labedaea rhizosphaerae]TDP96495.1 hypothetical protein EV186_104483 [Labedaea rhizosphaerae]
MNIIAELAHCEDVKANAITRLMPTVTFGLRVTALAGVAFAVGDLATGLGVLGGGLGGGGLGSGGGLGQPDGPTCCLVQLSS